MWFLVCAYPFILSLFRIDLLLLVLGWAGRDKKLVVASGSGSDWSPLGTQACAPRLGREQRWMWESKLAVSAQVLERVQTVEIASAIEELRAARVAQMVGWRRFGHAVVLVGGAWGR